ncbi:MAG TPA: ATP-binding protein [Opitutaceae bacterium]|jgi:PAS domain S-box-containing protein
MNPDGPHRVLVIDDTPAIHDDFRKVFQRTDETTDSLNDEAAALFGTPSAKPAPSVPDFVIESAQQGREGADLVRRSLDENNPYALAFVDMRMPPGWDGLETVQHLWRIDPRLQIVICTAHSDHSWQKINQVLGGSDSLIILKKPFDHIEARQLAHALVQKWKLARSNEQRLSQLDALVQERTRELHFAELRFTRAFEANPHAQILIALDRFEILATNATFRRQFNLPVEELKGTSPETFGRGMDPQRWTRLREQLIAGHEVDDHPFVFEPHPGVRRDLRCSARAVTMGDRLCSIWLLRDVTDQLRMEQQLRQAQKMDAVGQLAAGIAHDFNNLITVINAYVGMMLVRKSPNPADNSDLLQVRGAADRAAALTRQLLLFSRRQGTILEPADVGAILQNLREMLARVLPSQIALAWQVAPNLPRALVDCTNLEQAVMNLIINARDAISDRGEIAVSIAALEINEDELKRHQKARLGRFVQIAVKDSGQGMSPDVLAHIFEPFFTTKEPGKGTGLGLSTVYGIIDQHGGWVEVSSAVGAGTTFQLFLPAEAAA